MAHTVTAHRALWLKHWSAGNASKHSLCSIPFDGKLIFGKILEAVIQLVSSRILPCRKETAAVESRVIESSSYRPDSPFFRQLKNVSSLFPKGAKSKSSQAVKSSDKTFWRCLRPALTHMSKAGSIQGSLDRKTGRCKNSGYHLKRYWLEFAKRHPQNYFV